MALVKDRAVVLRRLDYSETSQILAVFTRLHGQQRLIAKGVKRTSRTRLATEADLLELGEVVFSQRPGKEENLGTLTEWRQEENFPCLRRDLRCCYAGQYAADVTAQLTEIHDPHTALFDALVKLLRTLGPEDPLQALVNYLWRLLQEIGLRPDLSRCVNCKRPIARGGPLFFSSREGGAVCRDCEPAMIEKRQVSLAAVWALLAGEFEDKSAAPAALDLLNYHLTEISGRPPKVAGLLKAALAARR